jgi:hypothetical protein
MINNDLGDEHFWLNNVNTPKYNTWKGLAFEELCHNHIHQIKKKLGILGVLTKAYQWCSKSVNPGAQIDLVIERKDDTVNLCEIKYSKDKFVISNKYKSELNQKIDAFIQETNTNMSIHLTMITTAGVAQNIHSDIVTNEVLLDDFFSEIY